MRLHVVLAAVVVLVIAYVGFWFFTANRVEDGFRAWVEARRAEGLVVEHGALAISGFPYRIRAELPLPRLAAPEHPRAPGWQAERLVAIAHPWSLNHVLFRVEGVQEMVWHDAEGPHRSRLQTAETRGSWRGDRAGRLERLSLDLKEPVLERLERQEAAHRVAAARAQLHLRPDPQAGDVLDIALSAQDVTLEGLPPLIYGPEIQRLELEAALAPVPPPGPLPAAALAWRDAGGVLELQRLLLVWGRLQAEASGTFALDEETRPIGAGTARVTGYDGLIEAAVASGQLTGPAARTTRAALDVLAIANGGVLAVPLSLQDGRLSLGPLPLLHLRPLFPAAS